MNLTREQYEEDLRARQAAHLKSISENNPIYWQPCMHDQCPDCIGTGRKHDGSFCVHMISCPCPKCTPQF